jgi:hypothetical protein
MRSHQLKYDSLALYIDAGNHKICNCIPPNHDCNLSWDAGCELNETRIKVLNFSKPAPEQKTLNGQCLNWEPGRVIS